MISKADGILIRRVAVAVLLIATALGLFFTAQIYFAAASQGHAVSLGQALYWAFGDWYEWAMLSPLLLFLAKKFPFRREHWLKAVAVHFIMGAFVSVVHAALCAGTAVLQARLVGPPATFVETLRSLLIHRFHFNFAAYGLIVCAWNAWLFQRQSQQREAEARELAGRLAETRLEMLRSQLNPHFLCNTLNTISSLMLTNPDTANQMMARLGDLLRVALQSQAAEATLRTELQILRRYLDIEQIRFGERLKMRFEIAPEAMDAAVPSLILQPIVENAIRHGLEDVADAQITLRAHTENGSLRLEVEDNGSGFAKAGAARNKGAGVGLANTASRLRLLYGERQQFEVVERAGGGVAARMLIPFHALPA